MASVSQQLDNTDDTQSNQPEESSNFLLNSLNIPVEKCSPHNSVTNPSDNCNLLICNASFPRQPEENYYENTPSSQFGSDSFPGLTLQHIPESVEDQPKNKNTVGTCVIGFEGFLLDRGTSSSCQQELSTHVIITEGSEESGQHEKFQSTLDLAPPNVEFASTVSEKPNKVLHSKPRLARRWRTITAVTIPVWFLELEDKNEGSTEADSAFSRSLNELRGKYKFSDPKSNSGLVWGHVTAFAEAQSWEFTVSVKEDTVAKHLHFEPYAGCLVEDFISEIHYHVGKYSPDEVYVLNICGTGEYLQNSYALGSHETLQTYQKYNTNIKLQLLKCSSIQDRLLRTEEDDQNHFNLNRCLDCENLGNVSGKSLTMALLKYMEQAEKLMDNQDTIDILKEEVIAVCELLSSIETDQIKETLTKIHSVPLGKVLMLPQNQHIQVKELLEKNFKELSAALSKLIYVYCTSFNTDLQIAQLPESPAELNVLLDASNFCVNVYALHKIPEEWYKNCDFVFSVHCSLMYAGKELCQMMKTEDKAVGKSLFSCIKWNKQIRFPIEIRKLPYETMLVLQLFGTSTSSQNMKALAWTVLPLYNKKIFAYGTRLLSMNPQSDLPSIFAPGLLDTSQPTGFVLQLCFPETNQLVFERPTETSDKLLTQEENEVCSKQIMNISQKYSLLLLSEEEQGLLWAIRSFHPNSKCCLPLMVGSAPNWNLDSLPEIYTLLKKWNPCHPAEALAFLTASFPDQEVRRTAVLELENLSTDELIEYLPQLIQAVKCEWDLESPLVKLLLERSLQSVRFAHHFYWLLNSALDETYFQSWYQKLLAALQFCVGASLNDEFTTEKKLMKALAEVAKKVRAADDSKRQEILKKELDRCQMLFTESHVCRLPLNPALAVRGIDVEDCSYFHSKTVPLKMSFFNADPQSKNISVILKTGDDLRQDMIVLQIARAMNRIWLQEGLDLQMVIYQCLATEEGQGMVELVKDATTLAKIHSKSGIIGPLKEDTLENWFRHHNPTKTSYEKALHNFLRSCAGWCIVTFIMGVCDRHNDNIMLKPSGHMFHIDFGKFLGNAEMIGSIKRDRAPFIFTTEMEYFITAGGKEPHCFQEFVELCCLAYNHVRRHSQFLMNLLELMLSSGMPELKDSHDLRYVVETLRPWDSDLEATSYFTRKIKESLDCFPVRLNNLVHILANMSTTMNSKMDPCKQDLKSMISKAGRGYIREASIIGFATKPECLYAVKVVCEKENVVMTHKTFNQFYEFHNKLRQLFPTLPLPEFPAKWVFYLGDLYSKRLKELNTYLELLFSETYEEAGSHDLVRSFFLEEMSMRSTEKTEDLMSTNKKPEVQLLISFVDNKLSILVKHLRNIISSDGSAPDAYVEIYILPDAEQVTKRKTKAVPKSRNPAYNEIIEYTGITRQDDYVLKLIVKNKGSFLAAVNLPLRDVPLDKDKWYPLCDSEI